MFTQAWRQVCLFAFSWQKLDIHFRRQLSLFSSYLAHFGQKHDKRYKKNATLA